MSCCCARCRNPVQVTNAGGLWTLPATDLAQFLRQDVVPGEERSAGHSAWVSIAKSWRPGLTSGSARRSRPNRSTRRLAGTGSVSFRSSRASTACGSTRRSWPSWSRAASLADGGTVEAPVTHVKPTIDSANLDKLGHHDVSRVRSVELFRVERRPLDQRRGRRQPAEWHPDPALGRVLVQRVDRVDRRGEGVRRGPGHRRRKDRAGHRRRHLPGVDDRLPGRLPGRAADHRVVAAPLPHRFLRVRRLGAGSRCLDPAADRGPGHLGRFQVRESVESLDAGRVVDRRRQRGREHLRR